MTPVHLARAASTAGAIGLLAVLLRQAVLNIHELERRIYAVEDLGRDVNRQARDLEDLLAVVVPIRHEGLEPLLQRHPLALRARLEELRKVSARSSAPQS